MDGIDATLSDLRVAEATSRDVASTAEGASVRAEVVTMERGIGACLTQASTRLSI